ncbi:MAG: hypothetical protein Q8P30_01050 [Candidatus Uhrbacteria bacterium]|nr:hypothetical protein [Candidatus Uhrbacteria bacterium]
MELEQSPEVGQNKWSKIWPILLTVIITALIIGGGVYLFQKNEIDTLREEVTALKASETTEDKELPTVIDEPSEVVASGSLIYQGEELGLSFEYPAKWEEITEDTDHGHFILKAGDDTFLSADNYPYEGPDRGFGWTDLAVLIEGSESIDNFCENPIFPQNNIRDCEVLTNTNGVTYVKTLEEMQAEGGLLGIAHNYYLFNPNADFSGIVISSIWLDENNLFNLENTLDRLVKSIKFTQ